MSAFPILSPSAFGPSLALRLQGEARLAEAAMLVLGFHTPDFADRAGRLASSCAAIGVPAAFIEAPTVHPSISTRGRGDLSLTKPSIIRMVLAAFGKPVLYLDADMVIREPLDGLEALAGRCDLAIYNWLADEQTDAWKPLAGAPPGKDGRPRYWEFRHAIDYFDPQQLLCSGATQLWSPSVATVALLNDWQAAIAAYPGVADDECLDFVFNNRDNAALCCEWLGKEYVRCPWWPQVRPVIAHPDPPGLNEPDHIPDTAVKRRFYPEKARVVTPQTGIPRAAIIDVEEGWLLRRTSEGLVRVEPARQPFWA